MDFSNQNPQKEFLTPLSGAKAEVFTAIAHHALSQDCVDAGFSRPGVSGKLLAKPKATEIFSRKCFTLREFRVARAAQPRHIF